jgi:hypothetical protein
MNFRVGEKDLHVTSEICCRIKEIGKNGGFAGSGNAGKISSLIQWKCVKMHFRRK